VPGSVGLLAAEAMQDPQRKAYILNESWPARLAQQAWSGMRLPGDVFEGRVDPFSDEAIRRSTDLATLAVTPPVAKGVLRGGGAVLDDVAKLPGRVHKQYHTSRLSSALKKDSPKTTHVGRIDKRLLDEINAIRKVEGEAPIGTRDIRVYEAVLRKFQEKRIDLEGLTPRQVAETIYRVVHGRGTRAERGGVSTSHRLVNKEGPGVAVGYVGRGPKDDVSLKSTFPAGHDRLGRFKRR
ncbi:MAG: hypothetical protein MJA84_18050, partial [Firmicutes bacterium]|nr:hypothetical protein [Bacillota bacterium]